MTWVMPVSRRRNRSREATWRSMALGRRFGICSKHTPLAVTRQVADVLRGPVTRYEADAWTFSRFAALVPSGSVSASSR